MRTDQLRRYVRPGLSFFEVVTPGSGSSLLAGLKGMIGWYEGADG
jgi:hypothetical protein